MSASLLLAGAGVPLATASLLLWGVGLLSKGAVGAAVPVRQGSAAMGSPEAESCGNGSQPEGRNPSMPSVRYRKGASGDLSSALVAPYTKSGVADGYAAHGVSTPCM